MDRKSSWRVPERTIAFAVDSSDNAKFAFKWFLEEYYKNMDELLINSVPELPTFPTRQILSNVECKKTGRHKQK